MDPIKRELLHWISNEAKKHIDKIAYYISQRKLDDKSIVKFEIGYLEDTKAILSSLREFSDLKGLTAAETLKIALELKIVSETKIKNQYTSLFGGRIIFPIFDVYGRIIALAGRSLSDQQKPKYFNTPFQKGKHLYGLNHGREAVIKLNRAIIVEGYFDVISSHRIEATHIFGVMGTALTLSHSVLISRYTNNLFLCLDRDNAGKASTKKYMEEAPDQLIIKVKPIQIPEGKDFDEFISKDEKKAVDFINNIEKYISR